jgi:hypothetical protein
MPEATINLVAVVVSAVVGMIIGMAWYSPLLFGNVWMKLSGMTKKQLDESKKKGMAVPAAVGFLAALVMSFVLAHFVDYTGATTALMGIQTGVWLWLGFIATVLLNSVLWEGKPVKLYFLNIAHYLAVLAAMGAILAVWV